MSTASAITHSREPGDFLAASEWPPIGGLAVRSLLETNSVHEGISGESSLALGIPFPGKEKLN